LPVVLLFFLFRREKAGAGPIFDPRIEKSSGGQIAGTHVLCAFYVRAGSAPTRFFQKSLADKMLRKHFTIRASVDNTDTDVGIVFVQNIGSVSRTVH